MAFVCDTAVSKLKTPFSNPPNLLAASDAALDSSLPKSKAADPAAF